jgi:hypothetical protein
MPAELCPKVERPMLGPGALKELQRMLCVFVGELEAMWERRN